MLSRLRRSAGLLLVLFASHLSMVTSGAVCTTPGMAAMNESSAASNAPMSDMGSSSMSEGAMTQQGTLGEVATFEPPPCSIPSQATCVTGMPCVNALGAAQADGFAASGTSLASGVLALTVNMPVSSGSAPDLPPPRA